MRLVDGRIRLSATDLANHLGCRHLTGLDHASAHGLLPAPSWQDPALEVLQERGFRHEAAYLAHLESHGLSVHRPASSPRCPPPAVAGWAATGRRCGRSHWRRRWVFSLSRRSLDLRSGGVARGVG